MPRTATAPADDEGGEQPENTRRSRDEQADALDQIDSIIADIQGDGGKVLVYRTQGGRDVWLGTVSATEFSLEWLAENHGGGDYRLRFKVGNSFAGCKTVALDPNIKPKAAPAEAAPVPAQNAALEKILERLERLEKPRADWTPEKITAIAGACGSIVGAIAQLLPKQGQRENINDILLAAVLKDRRQDNVNDPLRTLETYERLKAHFGDAMKDEDKDDWLSVIREVTPQIIGALAQRRAAAPAPASVVAMPPHFNGNGKKELPAGTKPDAQAVDAATAPATASPAGEASNPPATSPAVPPSAQDKMTATLSMTLLAGEAGADVDSFADLLDNSLTGSEFEQLCGVLEMDGWFDVLFAGNTRAEAIRPWLTKLRDSILSPPDDEAEDAPAAQAGKKRKPETKVRA